MNNTAYYLLLSSLASTALAACGEDCPHSVELKRRVREIAATDACEGLSADRAAGLLSSEGLSAERCADLCDDPTMNVCYLPRDYLDAFEQLNGLTRDDADASDASCPSSEVAKVELICTRREQRGRWSEGCPISGRRPRGLAQQGVRRSRNVADYLAHSAQLEAASVLAFEALARSLATLGAPESMVEECLEAARQEVTHARLVGELARVRGAEPAPPNVSAAGPTSLLELALENVVEGIVRESYGALSAMVSSRLAAAPDVRAALATIAVDESTHAALSSRIATWLEMQLSEAEQRQIEDAKQAAIMALRGELGNEPPPELCDELGIPSRSLALSLLDQLEAHIWAPAPIVA